MGLFDGFFCIAGPCVIEERSVVLECAEALKQKFENENIPLLFKCSFDKANRTSLSSFRGLGIDKGLEILSEVKSKFNLPIITDIHESWQADRVAKVVDVLQIPAFLCRQTDLICAAARTGKTVNIKKGQFMAPLEMTCAVEKARISAAEIGCSSENVWVTERGTFYGHNNLVVDMRNFHAISLTAKCPVIYDASHSVQLPGALGNTSGGQSQFIVELACAAVATGNIAAVYFETHPQPDKALCDPQIQLPLDMVGGLLKKLKKIYECVVEE